MTTSLRFRQGATRLSRQRTKVAEPTTSSKPSTRSPTATAFTGRVLNLLHMIQEELLSLPILFPWPMSTLGCPIDRLALAIAWRLRRFHSRPGPF
jgi:hypothetical protein